MTLSLPIRTERLVLRLLRPADTPRFAAYRADAGLARYQGWNPMTAQQARAFVASMTRPPALRADDWHQIAIADGSRDELLGDIGVCRRGDDVVELGFTLARDGQGRGFATEALAGLARALFERPDITRIVAETDERNQASVRVLERLGMTLESRRDAVFKQEACVELRYELVRGPHQTPR